MVEKCRQLEIIIIFQNFPQSFLSRILLRNDNNYVGHSKSQKRAFEICNSKRSNCHSEHERNFSSFENGGISFD